MSDAISNQTLATQPNAQRYTGYLVEWMADDSQPPLLFGKWWFTENGYKPHKMIGVHVKDSSMHPIIDAGDTIVINTEEQEPKAGRVFVVNIGESFVIRRMVRKSDKWWLQCDNPDRHLYPRQELTDDMCIVGRVVFKEGPVH